MKDLRIKIRRYKASGYLREKLHDDFSAEAEDLRGRMRKLCGELGEVARRATPEGDIACEFDQSIMETVQHARSGQFDDALRALAAARSRLQSMEEVVLSRKTIGDVERELARLEKQLAGIPGVSTGDFRILLARAQSFYAQAKYQTSRAIAAETLAALVRLGSSAEKEEAPPSDVMQRIGALEETAARLEEWGIAARDSLQMRMVAEACRNAMDSRKFELSRLLLADAEADKAQISVFLQLAYLRPETGSRASVHQLLGSNGDDPDWSGAVNQLLTGSLGQVSDWLQQRLQKLDQHVPAASGDVN